MASPKLSAAGATGAKRKGKMSEPVAQFLSYVTGKYLGPGLVAFILALCFWTFCLHWGVVLPVLWQWDPWRTVELSLCHHFIHVCLVMSLYKAVTRDPGWIQAEPFSSATSVQMQDANVCVKCHSAKPDRAHHCSQCKKCVRRMDHHCLFVNNCVGSGNYKFFVLLLVYTFFGGIINGLCIYVYMHVQTSASNGTVIVIMINAGAISTIGFMLGLFAGFHFWLSAKNATTLEYLRGDIGRYDLGSPLRNISSVFGKDFIYWLSPFHSISGALELFSPRDLSAERSSLLPQTLDVV